MAFESAIKTLQMILIARIENLSGKEYFGGDIVKQKVSLSQILVLSIIWLILVFLQHIVCFDFFDTNLWYLYLMAISFALLHYVISSVIVKKSKQFVSLPIALVYLLLSVAKLNQILVYQNYQPYPIGLTVCCFILDAIGALRTILLMNKFYPRKK